MGVSFRMSGRTEVSSFSSIVFLIFLLSFTNANNDLFTDFISNVLVDNQFSDGFFSELLAAKYIFEHDQYNDVFGGITKRSTDSKVNKGIFPQKKSFYKESNFSTDFWRPLPAPAPVYIGAKGGNQTYKVVYSKQAKTPQKFQKSPKFKKKFVQNVKSKALLQRKNYQQDQNITTYERKKLPRFLPPFPFGLYTKDPIRPFPTGSIFTVMPAFIIPFVPFGIWELRMPIGWSMNYLVERFNGYDDGSLTPGRSQARSFANQQMDFYSWISGFLSNTLGLDGKACIQRLICELAEAPVKERSLMGEILHRIVEPRREGDGSSATVNEYQEAEDQGRVFGRCFDKYGVCPLTVRRILPDNYAEMMKKKRK